MRLHELYGDLFEAVINDDISTKTLRGKNSIEHGLPPSFTHSMPATHAFPDMDGYYQFYRFVIAMAGHPDSDIEPHYSRMRDIPIAVAYTKAEHDMIHATAKRMGFKTDELAYHGSTELPDTYTVSPVMKFNMSETQQNKLRSLIKFCEAMTHATL